MSNATLRFATVLKGLARLLTLPQDCYLCGAPSEDALLCAACTDALPKGGMRCPVCGVEQLEGVTCGRCMAAPPAFARTWVLFDYAAPVDLLVHALKYGGELAVARFLGERLAERSAGLWAQGIEAIVAMPLHESRLRERGFNQAIELARPLARASGLPLLVAAVERRRLTPPQVGLARRAREANVRGAFACGPELAGMHVLVVDDVMTSGSSLAELARCLKGAGVREVSNLVLARTPRD